MKHSNAARLVRYRRHLTPGFMLSSLIVGILAALVTVAFRWSIAKAERMSRSIYGEVCREPLWLLLVLPALILLALLTGRMSGRVPMARGSGIPQVKGALHHQLNMSWWKIIPVKFIGGLLGISAGLSLGREGPSIQLGACMAQGFASAIGVPQNEKKLLMSAGAGAGLSAAFNAPLAGVLFVLEEIHGHFSPKLLLSVLIASVTADMVSKEIFGFAPVLKFSSPESMPFSDFGFVILLGVFCGFIGVIFNRMLLSSAAYYQKLKCPEYARPVIPFLLCLPVGLFLPELLGGGHGLIMNMATGEVVVGMVALLLALKILLTVTGFGSGVPGGIFLPVLAIGALSGALFSEALFWIPHHGGTVLFVILGMAACLTAVTRAPVTAAVLIIEMTGSFTLLLGLLVVSIPAYLTAEALKSEPVYEALLERLLQKEPPGQNAEGQKEPQETGVGTQKELIEMAVGIESVACARKISEISLPPRCLIISIIRNGKEQIPNGDTVIMSGDRVILLIEEQELKLARKQLERVF